MPASVQEKETVAEEKIKNFSFRDVIMNWRIKRLERQKEKWKFQDEKQIAKAEKKIRRKQTREMYRTEKRQFKQYRWFHFFSKWFFIGLVCIAAGVIVDAFWRPQENPLLEAVSRVVPGVLSTMGIALLMGSIFDFSKNSEHFMKFVTDLLSNIVVSKTFLTTMTDRSKEEALSLILRPTDKQIEQYPNINAFFKKRIKEFSTMFDINFKTNVNLEVKAYKKDGKVYCETTMTQTIYKIGDKFQDVKVIFEKAGSETKNAVILPPVGKEVTPNISKEEFESGGIKYTSYIYNIPEELCKYDHLVVKRTMVEPGFDHWINYYWQSTTPYEGVIFSLDCEEGLTIKDHMIFDNKAAYHVVCSNNKRRLEITSSQWLDTDTGFVVTVSDSDIAAADEEELKTEERL